MTESVEMTARKTGELSIKLADAALIARERGDAVHAMFFATKAAECLKLAKLLGWKPEEEPAALASAQNECERKPGKPSKTGS